MPGGISVCACVFGIAVVVAVFVAVFVVLFVRVNIAFEYYGWVLEDISLAIYNATIYGLQYRPQTCTLMPSRATQICFAIVHSLSPTVHKGQIL